MEYGNVAYLLEPFFYTLDRVFMSSRFTPPKLPARRATVSTILSTSFERTHSGNGVHSSKFLEKHAFAFHYRHTRLGAYVAETENGRPVGYNGYGVPSSGKLIAQIHVLLYLKTG